MRRKNKEKETQQNTMPKLPTDVYQEILKTFKP